MYELMPKLIIALLIIFGAVSLYTPLTHPEIADRWFSLPNLFYFSPVPILVLLFVGLILSACKTARPQTIYIPWHWSSLPLLVL